MHLPPASYSVLLVDLDGVLRRWPATDRSVETSFGLPEGAIRKCAFADSLLSQVITGKITDEFWRHQIVAILESNFPHARAAEAVREWSSPIGEIDTEVMGLLRLARHKIKVYLVTNATNRLVTDLLSLEIHQEFDAIVNSSEVGIAKPDAGIFQAALERASALPQEALFIDDSEANAAAARQLGIRSLCFQGADEMRAFLIDCQILSQT